MLTQISKVLWYTEKKKINISLSKVFLMCAQKAFCTKIKIVCSFMITYKLLLLQ